MFSEKIKVALCLRDKLKKDLAPILGCSTSNVYAKFRNDSFTEEDLLTIANALNYSFDCYFIDNETGQRI